MSDVVLARSDVPVVFEQQMHMARVLSDSNLLPAILRGRPANVLIILQGARALNVPAFWALQSMHVIEGKLSMSAELMRALVIRAGHRFKVIERTRQQAVVEIRRSDDDQPYRFEFTWQDAIDAELTNKTNWKRYPKAMLLARATSGAVRDVCPDVLFGVVYTPDELGAITDDDGNPEYVEGSVVQVPTGERVNEVADALLAATDNLDNFAPSWQAVVDLGWTLEKVPTSDLSLAEYAAELLRDLAKEAESADVLRRIWDIAKICGLREVEVHSQGTATGGEDVPVRLGDYLKARGEFVASVERAKADIAAQDAEYARRNRVGESPMITVDLPAEDVEAQTVEEADYGPGTLGTPAEAINTENARRLREEAAKTWDLPAPTEGATR